MGSHVGARRSVYRAVEAMREAILGAATQWEVGTAGYKQAACRLTNKSVSIWTTDESGQLTGVSH